MPAGSSDSGAQQVRRLSPARLAVFAAGTVAVLLALANLSVELAESRGWIETGRPDDHVRYVERPLFERDGESFRTTAYAEEVMVPSTFRAVKGDVFRVFLLGASFSMGTPYTLQSHGEERPGGIASWLRLELERRLGGRPFEVINVAAGAQTSHRVRRIAEEVLRFSPDLLVVATCNNEGPPKPGFVREQLHKLGGYRLLLSIAAPGLDAVDRPLFTPQMIDAEEVRTEFQANVRGLLDAAATAGVPVALATLPINLRYGGGGAPLPPADQAGQHVEDACVGRGRALFEAGSYEAALLSLSPCDVDIADAARWSGLSLAALGRTAEAKAALALSVELLPLNRCRPSLNEVTRALARDRDGVILVDLEAAAAAASAQGLPGAELFVDYCHLNWRGYRLMSQVLVDSLQRAGLIPTAAGPTVEEDEVARAWGLEEVRKLTGGGTP